MVHEVHRFGRGLAALIGVGVAVAALAAVVALSSSPSMAQSGGGSTFLGATTIRGNLTVEVAIDPKAGAASAQWAGPIKKVDEVTLMDQWAILRKREPASTGTLIVPRDKIVYINVVE